MTRIIVALVALYFLSAQAYAGKHCSADYHDVVFMCQTQNNKHIKVCANPENKTYQLTYGKRHTPEIVEYSGHPNDGLTLSFLNGNYLYVVNAGNNTNPGNSVAGSLTMYHYSRHLVTVACDANKPHSDFIQKNHSKRLKSDMPHNH